MKSTLKILCLDDDEEDFEIINDILRTSGLSVTIKRVDTKQKYIEAFDTYRPDVVLSDHSLSQFNSCEALNICKAQSIDIPFILVTGTVSEEFVVSCLKQGADDCVLKSNLKKLPGVIENVLKQKKSGKARAKASKELARRNEELSKLNKELDSLVYSVSHNLRAPLKSLLGLLNLAKNEADPVHLRKYHEMMENTILKFDNSLKDILEYSRNSKQSIRIERINVKKIIEENFEKMRFMPEFASLVSEILINDIIPFYSDAYRLSVIFNNLISNSIKYVDKGKSRSFIKISVTIDHTIAVIDFQDNGIGIEADALPKVFDMFFRATEKNEGAGLGLYIVKEAVDMLNGKIQLYSNPGEGTNFHIEIPNHGNPTGHDQISVNTYLIDRE